MKTTQTLLLALTIAATSFQASAAPTTVTATGAFDSVTGTYLVDSLYVGQGYSASFIFDTDAAAASYAQLTPSAEVDIDNFTSAYRFSGTPYGNYATANGMSGGFSSNSTGVRMYDNVNITSAQSGGLIADGAYDLVEFSGSHSTSICRLDNGCTDFEYTPTGGEEVSLYFLAESNWFSGAGLVQQLPNAAILSWLDVTTYEATYDTNGVFVGSNVIGSMRGLVQSASISAVPVPAAAWLLGSGLLGLVGVARRKAI